MIIDFYDQRVQMQKNARKIPPVRYNATGIFANGVLFSLGNYKKRIPGVFFLLIEKWFLIEAKIIMNKRNLSCLCNKVCLFAWLLRN